MCSHSGPTPRGLLGSAARIEVDSVLRSSNASIRVMVVVVGAVVCFAPGRIRELEDATLTESLMMMLGGAPGHPVFQLYSNDELE